MSLLLLVLPLLGAAVVSVTWYGRAANRASRATDDYVVALNLAQPSPYAPRPTSNGRRGRGFIGSLQDINRHFALGRHQSDPSLGALRQHERGLHDRAVFGSLGLFFGVLVVGMVVEAALLALVDVLT